MSRKFIYLSLHLFKFYYFFFLNFIVWIIEFLLLLLDKPGLVNWRVKIDWDNCFFKFFFFYGCNLFFFVGYCFVYFIFFLLNRIAGLGNNWIFISATILRLNFFFWKIFFRIFFFFYLRLKKKRCQLIMSDNNRSQKLLKINLSTG